MSESPMFPLTLATLMLAAPPPLKACDSDPELLYYYNYSYKSDINIRCVRPPPEKSIWLKCLNNGWLDFRGQTFPLRAG